MNGNPLAFFALDFDHCVEGIELLDVGGEGRYAHAWNLNLSSTRTLSPRKGTPIPRHIQGRAEAIPLPDDCVRAIVMERTPLRREAVVEMLRVIAPGGVITLRHHWNGETNPHAIAHRLMECPFDVSRMWIGQHELQQTVAHIVSSVA